MTRLDPARVRTALLRHGIAVLAALAALGLWAAMPAAARDRYVYVTFYPAVALVTLALGRSAAVTAVLASAIASAYFILPPRGSFKIERPADALALALFAVANAVVIVVAERYRRARTDATALADRLGLIIAHAPAALAVFDGDLRYLTTSRRWNTEFGLDDRDLRGVAHDAVFPTSAAPWQAVYARALRGEVVRAERDRFVRPDGAEHWLRWEMRPWRSNAGQICGVAIFAEDITATVRVAAELRAHADWLRVAVAAAAAGTWRWDPQTDVAEWSEQLWHLHGLAAPDDRRVTFEVWRAAVAPEDRDAAGRAVAAAAAARAEVAVDYRVKLPDGATRYLHSRAQPQARADGTVEYYGIALDITDRKRAEDEVRELNRSLEERVRARTAELSAEVDARRRTEVELERARRDEAALRARFEMLDRAALELSLLLTHAGDQPVHEMLQGIVDRARLAADAETAALGVGRDPERPFEPWVVSGLDAAQAARLGRGPHPRGVLGDVAVRRRTVRVRDLPSHPAFTGAPADHPAVRSFLGVPVEYAGRVVASLYLANKRRAEQFSAEDERTVALFAERAGVALELARLTEEVRAAVRARDDLLAVVSHDLRSPLSTARLTVAALIPKLTDDELRGRAERILRATARMGRLVEDLLQAATVEAGHLSVEASDEDVRAIVDELLEAARPIAAARAIGLAADVARGAGRVLADRQRVLQALSNLVGNAIKFSPDGGRVRVRATPRDGEVEFAVTDDGPGIAADVVDHLFERYAKGRTEGHRGVGLGLFITKGIVEAHGGRIWVESAPGHGSTFRFTLPRAADVGRRASAP